MVFPVTPYGTENQILKKLDRKHIFKFGVGENSMIIQENKNELSNKSIQSSDSRHKLSLSNYCILGISVTIFVM